MEKNKHIRKKPCGCYKIKDNEWHWKWHSWGKRIFYAINVPALFFIPLGFGKKYKALLRLIHMKKLKLKRPVFIIHQCGMFSGKLMAEINKPKKKLKNTMVLKSKKLASKIHYGSYRTIGQDINNLKKKLEIKPKEIYFWYTTCPKCVKSDKEHKTVIFIEV